MKTIKQLEQEAQQARENLIATIELGAPASLLADDMILAAVAMATYQFALGMQEISGDGSGKYFPEVSQEERDSDGWSDWNGYGHDCPIPENLKIEARFANGDINNGEAGQYRWHHVGNGYDLIAYRIVKGE